MKNVTPTEINAKGDVDFDLDLDTDTVTAGARGAAVNGNVSGSVINTGSNSGVMAGDDVDLEDSIVGNGNTQINDSSVGAFSGRGNATNISGENVNTGSGDLIDVDAEGDAQVVTGNHNEVTGAVDLAVSDSDGPINFAVGDDVRQTAIEDNSFTLEDNDNTREDFSLDQRFSSTFDDHSRTDIDATVDGIDNDLDVDLDA